MQPTTSKVRPLDADPPSRPVRQPTDPRRANFYLSFRNVLVGALGTTLVGLPVGGALLPAAIIIFFVAWALLVMLAGTYAWTKTFLRENDLYARPGINRSGRRRRRGWDVDIPRRRVAATPRPRRGRSVEISVTPQVHEVASRAVTFETPRLCVDACF